MGATTLAEPPIRIIRHARNHPADKRLLPLPPAPMARSAPLTMLGGLPVHSTARVLNQASILQLQRTMGNRSVQRHLRRQQQSTAFGPPIQRCGATPCGCSAEERMAHALEHMPGQAEAPPSIAAMPEAQRTALLQRLVRSVPVPAPTIQRDWWGDEEEAESEDSGSSVMDWVGEQASGAADWVGEQAGDAAGWVGEQAGGVADWASEQAGEAADWVGEQAGDAVDWAGEQAGGAVDWATEQAGDAADWIGEQAGSAADWAGEQVGGAVDWAAEQGGAAVDWMSEQGGAAVDWAVETGGEALDWASEQAAEAADWAAVQGSDISEWAGGIDPSVAAGYISGADLKAIEAALRALGPHAGRAAMIAAATAAAPALPLIIPVAVFLVISLITTNKTPNDEEERKMLEEARRQKEEREAREKKEKLGDCTEEQHRALQDEVNNQCKVQERGCDETQDCQTLKRNWHRNERCAKARETINKTCYKDRSDPGHQKAAEAARQAEETCRELYRKKKC